MGSRTPRLRFFRGNRARIGLLFSPAVKDDWVCVGLGSWVLRTVYLGCGAFVPVSDRGPLRFVSLVCALNSLEDTDIVRFRPASDDSAVDDSAVDSAASVARRGKTLQDGPELAGIREDGFRRRGVEVGTRRYRARLQIVFRFHLLNATQNNKLTR